MNTKNLQHEIAQAMRNDPLKDQILRISLFGSQLHQAANPESDIDLLIEFISDAQISYFTLYDLRENLEKKLGKKVDLVTPRALSKYFRADVLKNAKIVYEAG